MPITINPDLQSLIPALTPEEYAQLEANLVVEGCRDPLIVWEEEQTLLDGHNRYDICERHGLPYDIHEIRLADLDAARAWMTANQLGRRNLTLDQMRYYRGKQYELQKKVKRGGDDRKSAEVQHQKPHNEAFDNIAHELAVQHKVSKATIERDAVYAKAIDTLADVAGPGARQALLGRETKVTQQEVKALAKMATKHALTAKETLDAVHEAKTPKQARQIVREKVREVWEHEQYMDALARSNVPEDEWPASLRAKHTPAPADGLAPHFQRGQRSLETLKTCLTMVSLPDALDHHTEACIALGKACREVESLMTEHPAVCAALLGKPAAPMKTTTALAAPAASVSRKTPRPQRKPGALSERILEALHQHQPCINAKLAQTVDSKPKHTHKALLSLLKQGKVHKEGQQYWVVEALKGTTIAACVAEAS